MKELIFASEDKALQHLANLTGKRIKIAEESFGEFFWELLDTFVDERKENPQASEATIGYYLTIAEKYSGRWISGESEFEDSPEVFPEFVLDSGEIEAKPGVRKINLEDFVKYTKGSISAKYPNIFNSDEELLDTNSQGYQKVKEIISKKTNADLSLFVDDTFSEFNYKSPSENINTVNCSVSGNLNGTTLTINVDSDKTEIKHEIVEKEETIREYLKEDKEF